MIVCCENVKNVYILVKTARIRKNVYLVLMKNTLILGKRLNVAVKQDIMKTNKKNVYLVSLLVNSARQTHSV